MKRTLDDFIFYLGGEAQTVILATLCCIGGWFMTKHLLKVFERDDDDDNGFFGKLHCRIFQFLCVAWPFFIPMVFLNKFPQWKIRLSYRIVPKHLDRLKKWSTTARYSNFTKKEPITT